MNKFQGTVFLVATVSDWIARVSLIAIVAIVTANIIGRLFGYPILGTFDYVSLLAGIMISLSVAYCEVRKAHIRMSFLVERFPQRGQAIVNSIISIIGVVLFMVLAWQCIVWSAKVWELQEEVGVTGMPFYPFLYVLAFGSFNLSLVCIVDVYKNLSKAVKQ